MLIELGNTKRAFKTVDDRPSVTTIHIPEFDKQHRADLNHYGHKIGAISPAEFRTHRQDAMEYNDGTTQLPDHEALLAIVAAWPKFGRGRPAWVKATESPGLTPKGVAADLDSFLSEYYECPTLEGHYGDCDTAEAHVRKELEHWTKNGQPGECGSEILSLPDAQAVYTIDGRIMSNNNDGGDTLLAAANSQGVGSAATATTLTTTSTLTNTTSLPGHRIFVYTLSGNVFAWGNIVSNTAGANGVITVDQWYVPATPGGSAAAVPGTPWAWMVADGGMVSTWFCGLATGSNVPTATNNPDHTLAVGVNVEYVQAGASGLSRKICPTATDVSATARSVTIVPVFTVNSIDVANMPKTFTVAGFFASMVPGFGGAGGPMKFETLLTPSSASVSALNDQLTLTELIQGS